MSLQPRGEAVSTVECSYEREIEYRPLDLATQRSWVTFPEDGCGGRGREGSRSERKVRKNGDRKQGNCFQEFWFQHVQMQMGRCVLRGSG